LKAGLIGYPKMMEWDYHFMLRTIPEDSSSQNMFNFCVSFHQENAKWNIQGVSLLVNITAGDFPGPCVQKSSYKHVSNFGRLRSYDRMKLTTEGKNY